VLPVEAYERDVFPMGSVGPVPPTMFPKRRSESFFFVETGLPSKLPFFPIRVPPFFVAGGRDGPLYVDRAEGQGQFSLSFLSESSLITILSPTTLFSVKKGFFFFTSVMVL